MEDKLCSGDMRKVEALLEQAFWEAIVQAEGVQSAWQPGTEPTEAAFTVEEKPQARIAYPWNPTSPETEAFFTESAPLSIEDGWQEEAVGDRARAFFNTLDQVWATSELQVSLVERFAARMPKAWITAIAQQAQQIVADAQQTISQASATLSEQLVQCVRDVVPGLADDDFYVLARPLAVSMRSDSTTMIDTFVAQVPQVDWEQLSDVQRARLSLAVARYAIAGLQATPDA